MAVCESCGNDYEPSMVIYVAGRAHHFDCFECAIHKLAPTCFHCGTKIVGHGAQSGAEFFCCAHCARMAGKAGLRDSA